MYLGRSILVVFAVSAVFAFRADGQIDNTPPGVLNLASPDPPIATRLKTITLSLDFNNATLEEATNFLRVESKRLDATHQAINFIISPDAATAARPVTLALDNVPLGQAVQIVCDLAGVKFAAEGSAIRLMAVTEVGANLQPVVVAPDDKVSQDTRRKLVSIIVDRINFENLDIAAVVQFLAQKSKQLDPEHAGINFVLDPISNVDQVHREVTLKLDNVDLADVIIYIIKQTNLFYRVKGNVVIFKPWKEEVRAGFSGGN